ncbi:hypothetical protein KJ865_14605, partial [Myxococcota bacterium]|nr:hypothetical protein [Myxococcota bacterium]
LYIDGDVGFFVDNGTDDATGVVTEPILLNPHSFYVVGVNATTLDNGGVALDYEFAAMPEFNTAYGQLEVYRVSDDMVFDSVMWDSTWPHISGSSMGLSPAADDNYNVDPGDRNTTLNNDGAHWCSTRFTTLSGGDYGTAGAGNDHCLINWCNTQWPLSVTLTTGDSTDIYGQVYEPGTTDATGQGSFITAQLGYGSDGTAADETWTWVDATYNVDAGNNDEYMQTLTVPTAGDYDYAYRMSMDGGLSHVYCDTTGTHGYSGSDPYTPADNGDLTVLEPPTWQKIARGWLHACGLKTDGSIWCWGQNVNGQLGNGTTTDSMVPVLAIGTDWVDVVAGWGHTCALKTDGTMYCWGVNAYGNLGDGTKNTSTAPVLVGGGKTWVKISAGNTFTCAIANGWNELYCWGSNTDAQLGYGPTTDVVLPTKVPGGLYWSEISCGHDSTCAIDDGNNLRCWGANGYGRLGDGTTTTRTSPTLIATGYSKIAIENYHTCGIKTNGSLFCWGFNDYGQVGDGTIIERHVPTAVVGGSDFGDFELGMIHTCGVKNDGTLYCWGFNDYGQVGDGTIISKDVPTIVSGTGWYLVSASQYGSCSVTMDGNLYCWGSNAIGQVGDGTTIDRLSPVEIPY